MTSIIWMLLQLRVFEAASNLQTANEDRYLPISEPLELDMRSKWSFFDYPCSGPEIGSGSMILAIHYLDKSMSSCITLYCFRFF